MTVPGMAKLIGSERANLLVQIAQCRRLKDSIPDERTVKGLTAMIAGYEKQLERLEVE